MTDSGNGRDREGAGMEILRFGECARWTTYGFKAASAALVSIGILACNPPSASPEKALPAEKASRLTAELIHNAAPKPGQPMKLPGVPEFGTFPGSMFASSYAWVKFLRDGRELPLTDLAQAMNSFSATVEFPNGRRTEALKSFRKLGIGLFIVPQGYDRKPSTADLVIRITGNEEPVSTVKLTEFAEPTIGISPSEPRMANPRWNVQADEFGRLLFSSRAEGYAEAVPARSVAAKLVKFSGEPKISNLRVIRTTHVRYREDSTQTAPPTVVKGRVGGLVEFGAREVELEEQLFEKVVWTETILVKGLTLEKVHQRTVLNVPKRILAKTSSGVVLEIPKQRRAPLRPGTNPSNTAELAATVWVPPYRTIQQYLAGITAESEIVRIEPSPGKFGVGSIRLILGPRFGTLGSATVPRFISFPDVAQIRPGPLPPLKFHLMLTAYKRVATYKGIVPVRR